MHKMVASSFVDPILLGRLQMLGHCSAECYPVKVPLWMSAFTSCSRSSGLNQVLFKINRNLIAGVSWPCIRALEGNLSLTPL